MLTLSIIESHTWFIPCFEIGLKLGYNPNPLDNELEDTTNRFIDRFRHNNTLGLAA